LHLTKESPVTAPSKFAHVVYNTHRYDEMIDWYTTVFEARTQHHDERLTFMTYDDEHHRFAFVNLGPLPADARARASGKVRASTTSPTHGTTSRRWSPSTSG
jgi:hypothetical protein